MTDASSPYIYADNAATTPLSHAALDAMMPFLTETFGNPSGIHRIAREAAVALDKARASVADHLGAAPDEVYFTSGGSESDNWVLRGAVARWRQRYGMQAPTRIVTSQIEHHAILHCCRALERVGVEVIYLPVDTEGRVSAADLEAALDEARSADRSQGLEMPPAALVSIMLANNEVGTIQDIPALSAVAQAHGVLFHTDAVQAVGHIPVDVRRLGVDALSLSGHKFHGPRGTGALVLRRDISLPPLIEGGAQERGERAGTENVAGIVGLGRIGREIARRLKAFDMELAFYGHHDEPGMTRMSSLTELAAFADYLIVCVPGRPENHNLIDREVLTALGPQGRLINIARGSVVDEEALTAALEQGEIAGAALDVFAAEPHVGERLRALRDRTVLLPHLGSATVQTRQAMADLVYANIQAFVKGEPLITVVPECR